MNIAKGIIVWAKLSVIALTVTCATTVTYGALPFTVTNLPATDITASSAQLNGVVNPSGKKARYMFQTRAPGKKRFLRATPWTVIPKGQTNAEVAGAVTGLTADSTYEYRLIAMRGTARKVSQVLTFTANDPQSGTPSVTTGPATGVGAGAATLTGSASPNGAEPLTVYFEYGQTTDYGITTTSASVNANESAVLSGINGLANDTTYHFRLVGSNSLGLVFGADQSFSTAVNPPVVTTLDATAITTSGATLNGTVDPNGAGVSARFEYGLTDNYGTPTDLVLFAPTNGAQSLTVTISGLLPNTTYHYRVVINGSVTGGDKAFRTATLPAEAPTVTTTAATGAGATSATLNGNVNPNGAATTANFQWGTSTAYGNFTDVVSLSGDSAQGVVANLAGLAPNQTYHFRLVATNSNGTTLGNDVTFMTSDTPPSAPSAVTEAFTGLTTTSATLHGSVNPNRAETTALFEWGLTSSYGALTEVITIPAGNGAVPVTAILSGLEPNTTYHYRVYSTNSAGTGTGEDRTFTTPPTMIVAPTVAITANPVGTTTATLNGIVNPNGAATLAIVQYGFDESYGLGTFPFIIDAGNSDVPVTVNLEGLSPNTTYFFHIVAENEGGTTTGTDLTFTTAAATDAAKSRR